MEKDLPDLDELQKKIKYKFKNIELLKIALTHRSFINETRKKLSSNERYEFLGDSILNFIVSDYLFSKYKQFSEGRLAKLKSMLVSDKSLSEIAIKYDLGNYLLLGKGEEHNNGRTKLSILADTMEAIICSIYLDSDFNIVRDFIVRIFQEKINFIIKNKVNNDFKSILQEKVQRKYKIKPRYVLISETGPEHKKSFKIIVEINRKSYGIGEGKNKKIAEQNAAKQTLKILSDK